MDMTRAHKWEKGRKRGHRVSGSTGQTIKESRMARNGWSYQFKRYPACTAGNPKQTYMRITTCMKVVGHHWSKRDLQ